MPEIDSNALQGPIIRGRHLSARHTQPSGSNRAGWVPPLLVQLPCAEATSGHEDIEELRHCTCPEVQRSIAVHRQTGDGVFAQSNVDSRTG